MKKVLLAVIIIAVLMFAVACNSTSENALEKEITNLALFDLGIAADTPSELVFVSKEAVAWSDWECWEYELKVNGKRYAVGVQRNDKVIHFVDVEKEL